MSRIKKIFELEDATDVCELRLLDASLMVNAVREVGNCPYDLKMWNPCLVAIFYRRLDVLQYLLKFYVRNKLLALRKPPSSEADQYIVKSAGEQLIDSHSAYDPSTGEV